jgi:hypothetical protein
LELKTYIRWAHIGKPGYGWRAKIVDSNFNEITDGSVGELAVAGPGVYDLLLQG